MSVAEAIYKETCHVCEVINKTFKKVFKKNTVWYADEC